MAPAANFQDGGRLQPTNQQRHGPCKSTATGSPPPPSRFLIGHRHCTIPGDILLGAKRCCSSNAVSTLALGAFLAGAGQCSFFGCWVGLPPFISNAGASWPIDGARQGTGPRWCSRAAADGKCESLFVVVDKYPFMSSRP